MFVSKKAEVGTRRRDPRNRINRQQQFGERERVFDSRLLPSFSEMVSLKPSSELVVSSVAPQSPVSSPIDPL